MYLLEHGNTTVMVLLIVVMIIVSIVHNKKEYFYSNGSFQSKVPMYTHKDIKPFGYGYRPYYGYNTYMYSNSSSVSYARPIFVPIYDYNYDINKTYSFPFKLYGMY